jgi:isopenicillin N synthase-like dioxygenase/HD superfamily phosphodiesterase
MSSTADAATTSMPVVPIISWTSPTAVEEIDQACSTIGGFVLTDHGIPTELLDSILKTGHSFFELPEDVKQHYNLQKYGAKWRGYMPVGGERSVHGTRMDYKEGLYMGDEHSPEDPKVKASMPTFGSNVYADEELPEMRPLFHDYHKHMTALGNQMMDTLSDALGLETSYLQTYITQKDPVILPRMFRYLPQQPQRSHHETSWGIGRHSDYGLWTMILTDQPGLEFQIEATGEWVPVPFVKHGIVMNVGDVLDRLTSGRYISPYHRARNHSFKTHRLSLPFFYDPAWDAGLVTLPLAEAATAKRNPPPRWENTKITGDLDGSVAYSEFLAKKVAKVFPDLVPEDYWRSLASTSSPSTRHALVVESPDIVVTRRVVKEVQDFYEDNPQIKASHGWSHVQAVYHHACEAVICHKPQPLISRIAMEIQCAALLHDVDDHKYFPAHEDHENAREILERARVPRKSVEPILYMISLVSCSENGNHVPSEIKESGNYYWLIPRWSDRLEAVGKVGVVRCFQYNHERQRPLSSPRSPRAQSREELWELATPQRFESYQETGDSDDMISHYYDKLLHIACPPKELVRNAYLERMAEESSKELVEVCLRFGKTGQVDEGFIRELAEGLNMPYA